MNDSIHNLSLEVLGERLRLARETSSMTQAAAATAASLSRTTLLAIEQGKRPVKDDELITLTDLYGVTLNDLLRREAVHVDLVPRFRKLSHQKNEGINEAINLLSNFVTAEVELENLLGVDRISNLPPERPLRNGDVRKQAYEDAADLRRHLGLGNAPVRDLFSILELDLGIRVYTHPLPAKVSGLFAYENSVGACVLINSQHRYDRQEQTGTHELGHVIGTRFRPDVCQDDFQHNSREERYANAFAPAFLMPAEPLLQRLSELRIGSKRLTRRHVIISAHYWGVSREGYVRRLEELKTAPEGTWDWFKRNGGITDVQAREVLGHTRDGRSANSIRLISTSLRLETLAAQALERDILSEGQVADLLKINRIDARRLRDDLEGSVHEQH